MRVIVAAFRLAGRVELIAGGEGGGDVGRGVAGRSASIGTAVLAREERDRVGKGERNEGKRQKSKKLGMKICISLAWCRFQCEGR